MENERYQEPEWHDKERKEKFAVKIVKPSNAFNEVKPRPVKKNELPIEELAERILAGERTALAKAITLVESNSEKHFDKARKLLEMLMPQTGNSIRIGISGIPGAGKSTFIEKLGLYLIEQNHKVAVLAVDPSSTITKGSILGDKTRMEKLSQQENAFIRPSPSGGALGGVARKSREIILLYEAAGYDVILVETVGVGQSEITVRTMVDFFLLMMIAGTGDSLQGIKRGILEIADALFFNKAEGENKTKSEIASKEFETALKYFSHPVKNWQPQIFTGSALNGVGIKEFWDTVLKFVEITKTEGYFYENRKKQTVNWVFETIENELKMRFYNNKSIRQLIPQVKDKIINGELLPVNAVELLLRKYFSENQNKD